MTERYDVEREFSSESSRAKGTSATGKDRCIGMINAFSHVYELVLRTASFSQLKQSDERVQHHSYSHNSKNYENFQ